MDSVIPWSEIHPKITSRAPFVAVVIIDPGLQLCVSEFVSLEEEQLGNSDGAAGELVAGAQRAAARAVSGYRTARRSLPGRVAHPVRDSPPEAPPPVKLRVVQGGAGKADDGY